MNSFIQENSGGGDYFIGGSAGHACMNDLVVKSQAADIIDLIAQLIRHQNGVHRSCRNRTSRGAVFSTSEVQWATT
jgi:hypothetical protein